MSDVQGNVRYSTVSASARLIGEVVASRLHSVIQQAGGARSVYAMVDLGKDLTCAIGEEVSRLSTPEGSRIEVAIHGALATQWVSNDLISNEAATWFRNHSCDDVIATLFSVPGEEMERVLQSLGTVERINHTWILDATKSKIWAHRTLPSYKGTTVVRELALVIRGLMKSGILASANMLAEYCIGIRKVMIGGQGLTLRHAASHALPSLQLPRNCLADNESKALMRSPATVIRRVRNRIRPYLYLTTKRGDLRIRREMFDDIDKLQSNGDVSSGDAALLRDLVGDKEIIYGVWRESQRRIANVPWTRVRKFFETTRRRTGESLGTQTIKFLDDEHPGTLLTENRESLEGLKGKNSSSTPELERIYAQHREHLKEHPRLYKRWHRLIFNRPIQESDDLLLGLLKLAERAFTSTDELNQSRLVIRLRNSDKMSFWRKNKNFDLCEFLRDRYRGLEDILRDKVELRFGRCWDGTWDHPIDPKIKNKKGHKCREFEFEAFLVPKKESIDPSSSADPALERPVAQLIWAPDAKGFATAVSSDLRRVLPNDGQSAHLLRARVTASQGSSGAKVDRPTLWQVASIIDSLGESEGSLANPDDQNDVLESNRISDWWLEKFRKYSSGVLTDVQREKGVGLFRRFQKSYSSAIGAIISTDGRGLADPSLVGQAEDFGRLLGWLRRHAVSDVLVRETWEPLLEIGTATVEGAVPAMIVAPWHPLRLVELAAKAYQAGEVIDRLISSSSNEAVVIEDYVNDRLRGLADTYYANTTLVRSDTGPRLLVETEQMSGYSLLQSASADPVSVAGATLVEKPVKDVVRKFGEIAEHYLELNPHDRSNFSVVLFDSESDDLAAVVAKHLSRKVQQQPDLRCDLTVTHRDPMKLRKIYERQNRRIGRELESALTSEAARTFLSRLRIGITSPPAHSGDHYYDILLLHDVLAPNAKVTWHIAQEQGLLENPLRHTPNDVSRRKSLKRGSLSTSVYLTAPYQIQCTQPYLDVLHDAVLGKPSDASEHFVPAQEVEFSSVEVKRSLDEAHRIARWVVTYDRIADRRMIGREDDSFRILRYFSAPRSKYNVIVSTELSRKGLRSRLEEDVDRLLSNGNSAESKEIADAIHKRATGLSGGILMRGSLWDNYARELIGVIVTQRELELLLEQQGADRHTAMYFLDEIHDWLDLRGEFADILAVDLQADSTGLRKVQLVVAEAKCVGNDDVASSKAKSWNQLEETYTAMVSRFCDSDATVDSLIWFKRLADLLVEHMDPWANLDRLGGWSFDEWIEGIRRRDVHVEVSAHSVVTVHDQAGSVDDLGLITADPHLERMQRRKLAQWILGADLIKRSIRGVVQNDAKGLLHVPDAWPDSGNKRVVSGQEPKHRSSDGLTAGTDGGASTKLTVVTEVAGDLGRTVLHTDEGSRDTASGKTGRTSAALPVPVGWSRSVFESVSEFAKGTHQQADRDWLEEQTRRLRMALQQEKLDAPVEPMRVTPNAGLIRVDGQVDINWLIKHQIDRLLVRHSIEIVRITPKPGYIVVSIKRPKRKLLRLSDAWLRRQLGPGEPIPNLAPVIGENEDDGELLYLPLVGGIGRQPPAAPHTLVSGTTGSGKGILAANLILDICAFNSPKSVEIYLIDPKRGADYLWATDLPHLRQGIVDERNAAAELLERLVAKMDRRYQKITAARCPNIVEYNRKCDPSSRLPYLIILFDEVANWMQDDRFKKKVDRILNSIATKSRAAGFHLVMIYQRADALVMTMQLRTNLGNKLILKLGDPGSSKIALGEKGAEALLGKGHIIADIGTGDKIYGQVPYIEPDEAQTLAAAIGRAWSADPE